MARNGGGVDTPTPRVFHRPFSGFEIGEKGEALLKAPTEELLNELLMEHEPTEDEIKTAALFWAFIIAAADGQPVNRIFFYRSSS